MGFTKYTTQAEKTRVRMNEGIRVPEVRVIGPNAENYGVLKIEEALEKAAGNRSVAARILGVSRRTLYNKLEALGLTET